jgi:hypothetical protein
MLRDRLFVKCLLARQLRKVAVYKNRNNQFTVAEFDQFMAKCRSIEGVDALCDAVEDLDGFNWKSIGSELNKHFAVLRRMIDALPEVDIEAPPQMFYNMAPETRGRRARRAMGPRYQVDEAFQKDKEQFEAELRGDVGPLGEEPNEESTS